jgi:hypothetical protein
MLNVWLQNKERIADQTRTRNKTQHTFNGKREQMVSLHDDAIVCGPSCVIDELSSDSQHTNDSK